MVREYVYERELWKRDCVNDNRWWIWEDSSYMIKNDKNRRVDVDKRWKYCGNG